MNGNPLDQLASMPEKYRQAVHDHTEIRTIRDFVLAERAVIKKAISAARKRPAPTLEDVARWQDDARVVLRNPVAPTSDRWTTAACFAVEFRQQQDDSGRILRRIELEQTEIEPEQPSEGRDGWDPSWVPSWMLARVGLGATSPAVPAATADGATGVAATTKAVRVGPRARRLFRFASIAITEQGVGPIDLLTHIGRDRVVCSTRARLAVELEPGSSRPECHLVVQASLAGGDRVVLYDDVTPEATLLVDLPPPNREPYRLAVAATSPDDRADPAVHITRAVLVCA